MQAPAVEVESLRLGRYPGTAGVNYYVERMEGRWRGRTTLPEEARKLRQEIGIFEDFKAQGLIESTDPRHISAEGIRLFLREITHMDPDSQRRHISRLNRFLKFYKNFTLETMLVEGEVIMPKCAHKNIEVLELEELQMVLEASEQLTGWHGSINRGMLAFYCATLLRPSELREAEFRDYDAQKERLFVRLPKGVGSWAAPEWVDLVYSEFVPMVERYLVERDEHIRECGRTQAAYLFPNLHGGKDSFYSANSWRKIKQQLVEASGVDFRIKDLRATMCSLAVNDDLKRLPLVSIQMRHKTMGTTQQFYAKIQRSRAGKQLKDVLRTSRIITPKKTVIEKDSEVTGWC